MEIETPRTRSKTNPGSSQGRVTWAHDHRWKHEWLADQNQEVLPPTPTQVRPVFSRPAALSTPLQPSSSRPAKRKSRLGRYPSTASEAVKSAPSHRVRQTGSDGTGSSTGTSASDPSPNNLVNLLFEWETLAAKSTPDGSHPRRSSGGVSARPSPDVGGVPQAMTERTRSAPDVVSSPVSKRSRTNVLHHTASESNVPPRTPAAVPIAPLGQSRRLPSQKTPSHPNILGHTTAASRPLQSARSPASPIKSASMAIPNGPAPRIGIVSKTRFSDPKSNTPFKPPTFTSSSTPVRSGPAHGQALRSSPRNHAQRRVAQNAQTPLRSSVAGRHLDQPLRSAPRLRANSDDGRSKEAKEPSSDGLGDESFDSIDFADESNAEVLRLLEVMDRKCGQG